MKRTTLQSKTLPKSHPMRRKAERRAHDEQERKDNGQFGSGSGGSKNSSTANSKKEGPTTENHRLYAKRVGTIARSKEHASEILNQRGMTNPALHKAAHKSHEESMANGTNKATPEKKKPHAGVQPAEGYGKGGLGSAAPGYHHGNPKYLD